MLKYALVSSCLLVSSFAYGECKPWAEQNHSSNQALYVGNIELDAQNVFDNNDVDEQRFVHRLTNKLHKVTADDVIRRQLLVKSGDRFDPEKLRETERLLRKNRYLRNATIIPMKNCGSAINLRVTTSDSWSLVPALSFGRAGGVNKSSFAFKESNLFGRGKFVELKAKTSVDRDEKSFRYMDPQLFGTRKNLLFRIQDNSDGKSNYFKLERPFYSRETPRAWGLTIEEDKRIDALYLDGEVDRKIEIDRQTIDFYVGRSLITDNNTLVQARMGMEWSRNDFQPISGFSQDTVFSKRHYAMPYIDVIRSSEQFAQYKNYRTMDAVEDISIGSQWNMRFGVSNKALGATENSLIYNIGFRYSHLVGESALGLYSVNYGGEVGSLFSNNRNAIFSIDGEWFVTQSKRRKLFLSASAKFAEELYPENQLVLGGVTGLRGYPQRFQSGANMLRATLEQRWYYDWYPWRLVRLGAAAFADAGTAWGDTGNEKKLLKNVGFGLRFIPTRQSQRQVLHLDVAFPLDDAADISGVQLILKAKREF